ncbi:F-box only protein 6 isoform X1 [Nasonia vitripennis]|uniref:Uncharacterized protein n=2 Tax=Nasonia vitripennis TaxID=7425 RepID=A0A7M7M628_NASVI|nr:F-box only protein 6 isoform X1 [Nasonia vitripennis]XP_031776701.1 F-box only protein 6 isoform X1 [Nasonia vitripennis]
MFKFTKKAKKKLKMAESRVKFDEDSSNGLFIEEKYIPEEILSLILCYVDHKTLLACQLVCKQWQFIMQDFVWHKIAELRLGRVIPKNKSVPWQLYYFSCTKPFEKNLIKNHSGELGLNAHWTVTASGGNGWKVEAPPHGVPPLPDDPVFEDKVYCFVTSFYVNPSSRHAQNVDILSCHKFQIVDLIKEGFAEYLLDNFQPKIKVSEWIASRWDCSATYGCDFQLIGVKNKKKVRVFDFKRMITELKAENNTQNEWIKVEYTFEGYGKGLRKIKFMHGGQDRRFWRGHYGSKMAGACVKVENPLFDVDNDSV